MARKSPKFGAWALVTGANSGIGAAFTRTLAKEGYNIVLVGRRKEALSKAAAELRAAYPVETQEVVVDLGQDGFLAQIEEQTGDLDLGVLVSNAGDAAMGALLKVDLSRLTQMLRLNTQTHLELVHHFGRRFAARGRGGILLVSSTAGLQGTPYVGNYAGAKAYLLNLGMALNYEMRGTGVNVSVVVPGPTDTPGLNEKPAIPLATLPAPKMKPEAVARIGLRALRRNRPFVVAGMMNRVMGRMGNVLGKIHTRNMWGMLISGIVPRDLKMR
jgi:short-subunit dehydrogenase